jgi:hypothetical protein
VILKASQRGGGQDLAAHLMRLDDNEHVRIHELRGFASEDLRGAFKEAEAISRGTKCQQYLFSLSLNPPQNETVSDREFETAIAQAEKRLGLTDQPRAIVFHEKQGRTHAHCVWSRIDPQSMTAKQMGFYKARLTDLSRELYLEHGWSMPRGLAHPGGRDPTNFTLAEWQQAKRLGQDPRWLKSVLQDCWRSSDNALSFNRALEERGFFLARGDRRGVVVIGHDGEVHALSRALGLKTKDVRARLGDGEKLKGVAETQAEIGRRMTPAIRRHIAESRERFAAHSAVLGRVKEAMTREHREARLVQESKLNLQWEAAARERASRLPTGFKSLWQRLTGEYGRTRKALDAEADAMRNAQAAERARLHIAQRAERRLLQERFRELRSAQASRLLDLRKEVGRFLIFTRRHEQTQARDRSQSLDRGLGLRLER